jgi:two-component system phosphate regulon sensor histidine kinase PhoR
MKNPTPQRLALFTALLVAFVVIVIQFLSALLNIESSWAYYALLFLAVLGASYFLFYNALELFIYRKIKLIYKSIYYLKTSREKITQPKLDLSRDLIAEVNAEVLDWVKENKDEVEQLKRLEAFRREFLGNVSHELKTPLFAIQGYIHTLLEGGIDDEHINILYLEKAARSVERLVTIVDDLEAISKHEAGDLVLELRTFDIYELAKETFDQLDMKAKERNISLSFKDGCDRSFYVEADKERIRQVLVNLVVNSIKYGKLGGKSQIGLYDMDQNILVEVSDNGLGIDEQHIPRLFERFFRVDKSRSRDQGGTGLGLSIVKHIIEAHNQTINVRSTIGLGATFGFTLKKAKN